MPSVLVLRTQKQEDLSQPRWHTGLQRSQGCIVNPCLVGVYQTSLSVYPCLIRARKAKRTYPGSQDLEAKARGSEIEASLGHSEMLIQAASRHINLKEANWKLRVCCRVPSGHYSWTLCCSLRLCCSLLNSWLSAETWHSTLPKTVKL